ncbi:MAG TPA: carboxypeptidase-like regulatory domain-containing protein [Pyrinomonadaceae bacterium]|nr:carboxypeptidase-like regulatory domain-containing protein [Pyrinomonadaceae bacterium]
MSDESVAVLNSALRALTSALLLFVLCASGVRAQAVSVATPTPERVKPRGSITGRVVGEDGQPVNGARVFVHASRNSGGLGGGAVSGPDGAFKVEGLEVAPYHVTAQVPGAFDAAYLEYERGARAYYRPGDDVSLRVLRGGVITGRVTDARGEPAAGVRVNLVRVRTPEGAPVREVNRYMGSLERMTDDRGVYRSYGLLPGVYVVSAGGRFTASFGVMAHADEAPTFYPSATRDAATEVTVRAGEEVGAVDVRLRGERGHAVSGTVAGVTESAHAEQTTILNVISADSTEYAGQFSVYGRGESEGFSIDGLTDGDYDLIAERFETTKGWRRAASFSRRVQIRGADVTGLRVTFAPLASLSGRIVFETPPASNSKPSTPAPKPAAADEGKASAAARACKGTAEGLWAAAAVVARRDASAAGQKFPANEPSTHEDSPDDKGEFAFRSVVAGTYRLDFKLGPGYFVTGVRRGARAADAAASVVRLARGEQVSDVTVTAAYGAARVEGRVSFPECDACPNARARVYLVPQERERADDVLRYSEAAVEGKGREGEFSIDSIAPGRYALVALPEPARKRGVPEQPAFLDADSRARLRREAEARGTRLTLGPCEHAEGVAVSYAPTP